MRNIRVSTYVCMHAHTSAWMLNVYMGIYIYVVHVILFTHMHISVCIYAYEIELNLNYVEVA